MVEGWFVKLMVVVRDDQGQVIFDCEEYFCFDISFEGLVQLKLVFEVFFDMFLVFGEKIYCEFINQKYLDVVIEFIYYVGILFGVVDGVVCLFLVLKDYVECNGFRLWVWIVVMMEIGDCLIFMFNVLVLVVKKVFEKVGLMKDDIDVWEVNEVFVVVVEKFICDLGFDCVKVNFNGGLIVLGYLIGVIGVVFIGVVLDEFERISGWYGLVIMCVVGGMVLVIIIEWV